MESRSSSAETVNFEDFVAGRLPPICPVHQRTFLDRIMVLSTMLHHNIQVWQQLTDVTRENPSALRRSSRRNHQSNQESVSVNLDEFQTLRAETQEMSMELAELTTSMTSPSRPSRCWCGNCSYAEPRIVGAATQSNSAPALDEMSSFHSSVNMDSEIEIKEEILDVEMPYFEEVWIAGKSNASEDTCLGEDDPLHLD